MRSIALSSRLYVDFVLVNSNNKGSTNNTRSWFGFPLNSRVNIVNAGGCLLCS